MKDVPVLRVPFRIGRIGLIFSKFLKKKALKEAVEVGAAVVRAVGDARPRIAVAEKLPREAPAGLDSRTNPSPEGRERAGLAEGKGETCVDKPCVGNPHLLERPEQGRKPVTVHKVVAGKQAFEGLGVAVDRGDAPAAAQKFGRVAPFAATEINGERGGDALSFEVPQGGKQRVTRRLARHGGEVARPVPRVRVDVSRGERRRSGWRRGWGWGGTVSAG